MAEVEVDYRGELAFKASTVLTMKNAAFSLIVVVRINRIAGKVAPSPINPNSCSVLIVFNIIALCLWSA